MFIEIKKSKIGGLPIAFDNVSSDNSFNCIYYCDFNHTDHHIESW